MTDMTAEQALMAQFEPWAREWGLNHDNFFLLAREGMEGPYSHYPTNCYFECFKAGAALTAQRVPEGLSHILSELEYAAFNLCTNTTEASAERIIESTCPEVSLWIAIRDLKSLLTSAQSPADDVLTCDTCGTATDNPWHYSSGERRHLHACDKCRPMIDTVPPYDAMADILRERVKCTTSPTPAHITLETDLSKMSAEYPGAVDWTGSSAETAQDELAKLRERVKVLEGALDGLLAIIGDSRGVTGYHLNGDIAEWDEFEEVEQAARLRGGSDE